MAHRRALPGIFDERIRQESEAGQWGLGASTLATKVMLGFILLASSNGDSVNYNPRARGLHRGG